MSISLDIADLAANEKKLLKGFKVLGLFPFYLRYITVRTHIRLCAVKKRIESIKDIQKDLTDFYNVKIQAEALPLLVDYCTTALINDRAFGFLLKPILKRKLNKSSHYHLLTLFITIQKFNEPAFFLMYWKLILQNQNTLLKEDEPLSEK